MVEVSVGTLVAAALALVVAVGFLCAGCGFAAATMLLLPIVDGGEEDDG